MFIRRYRLRRYQVIPFIILGIFYCIILYLQEEPRQYYTRKYIELMLAEELVKDKGSGCNLPQLDPFAKEITDLESEGRKVKCGGMDWVKCYYSTCKVVKKVLDNLKNIMCVYRDIVYESDVKYFLGAEIIVRGEHAYMLKESDHVKISCNGTAVNNSRYSKWKGYGAGLRTSLNLNPVPLDRKDSMNVLIFGFDSTSKNGFIRKMPRSYKYLTEIMNGTILNGYNILGDGTPPTLFPLLTGKTELELPEVRKKTTNNNSLDLMPFIFYKLKDHGYRTAYLEDMPWLGTFQYRFNGFRHQPTDHYLRSFFLEEKQGNWWKRIQNEFCLGDTPQYKFMMNITEQILRLEGKKFIFTFISDITHDDFDMISTADTDMVMFLETLVEIGALKNTLVIVMGDHGQRFSDVRNTFQGKLEERLPLVCIFLPEEFKRKRPKAQSTLEANVNSLTTPHDIHATLLDVLDMKVYMNPYKVPGADLPRAMSLLEPIPRNRSCSEAGIEPHWCACLTWHNVSKTDKTYKKAAVAFTDYVNLLTEQARIECAFRELVEIKWVMRKSANKQMLSFVKSKNGDGYSGKFGGNVRHAMEYYHIRVVLDPGFATYEASMKYLVDKDKFVVDSRDISRTDKYGREPNCISDRFPHLNPYCYCLNI